MTTRTLTDLESRILDFAARHDVTRLEGEGTFDALVAEFGWRPVTYLQRLSRLLDDPTAEAARPLEVRRLRRLRDGRRASRLSVAG